VGQAARAEDKTREEDKRIALPYLISQYPQCLSTEFNNG